ncbi:MAG: response regulator [Pseudolabrys sp.]|jgi:two-component system, chemotaxis family, chemotaxis protein CheY
MSTKLVKKLIDGLNILVADGNPYMRKVTRIMLMNLGAKSVIEVGDGLGALEAIRTSDPDVMLLDWDMPILSGPEVLRIVRSPGVFPRPNLPIIMLTYRAERHFVNEAMRAGVHEFLIKPTSPKALQDRLMSILMRPRPMLQVGDSYVPKPRPQTQRDQSRTDEQSHIDDMQINALLAS